jgi:MFS family permease
MTAIATEQAVAGPGRYRALIRTPGAMKFAVPGLIGRMPIGMLSLGIVLLVVAVTGRYGIAGAVGASGAVAYAVATPQVARLVDRYGQRRVLRPLMLVFGLSAAALVLCASRHAPLWTLFVTGGLTQASMPALGSMVRARWSNALGGSPLLHAAFSLEAIADELIFITGPILVVVLATQIQPVFGVTVTAGIGVAGVLLFAAQRRTEPVTGATAARVRGTALRTRGLLVLIGMQACLGALFSAVDLATVAFAQAHGGKTLAGPVLGVYGLGSAIGGLWYGSRRWRTPLPNRLLAALAATVLPMASFLLVPNLWWMFGAIFAAGLGISATLINSYSIAEAIVPVSYRTEGMTWLPTASSAGTAIGAPLAGHLVDSHGAGAGYLFAFAAGLAALAFIAVRRRRLIAHIQAAQALR